MKKEDARYFGFRERGKCRNFQSFALEIVPGWTCQLRCANCYKGKKSALDNGRMPKEFVMNALAQAKGCDFGETVFIGGEPTLHPALPGLVVESLRLGMTPIVVTNGIKMADRAYVDEIALNGVTLVLHAPFQRATQDSHAGLAGYHDKLMQAYDNVLGRDGVTVVAEMLLTTTFLPQIPDVYRWCRDRGVNPYIEMVRRNDDGVRTDGTPDNEEVHRLFQSLAWIDNVDVPLTPPMFAQPCTMAITGVHVKNFGSGDYGGVYSCCAQHVRHGDMKTESLTEILATPGMRVFKDQDEWIYGPCTRCADYNYCKGGCRGEAALAFGCPRASCPLCWKIPAEVREDPAHMVPPNCAGCPLEDNPACHPRR